MIIFRSEMISQPNNLIKSLMSNDDNLIVIISNECHGALLALEVFNLYFFKTPLTSKIADNIFEYFEGRLLILVQS